MPKLTFAGKEYKTKAGVLYKPLFCRYIGLETWRNIEQLMVEQKMNLTQVIDFAIKKALGK